MYRLAAAPFQILRGMRHMPHVGSHPGVSFMFTMLAFGVVAGFQAGGWKAAIFVGIMTPLSVLPIFAYGAYDRARISDTNSRREEIRALLGAYLATLPEPPQRPADVKFLYWSDDDRLVVDMHLTCGRVVPVETPDWLRAAVLEILTRSRAGPVPHRPRAADLASMRIEPPKLSSHLRMQALGIIRAAGAPVT